MTLRIRTQQKILLVALTTLGLLPATGFAKSKSITTKDLLQNLSPTEPWRKGRLTATKTVSFNQTASGGTDATTVSKVTLAYFTSADCKGAKAGNGFYTTPDGTSFTISVGTAFGMVAASTWNVGSAVGGANIADMTTINSVAITLKSTNNDVPQSDFSGNSFSCVPVTCAANACTSVAATQDFELKTTAAVGDPADGGVIADLAGLVAPAADNSTSIVWGGFGTTTNAQSDTDGAANTTTIVTALGANGGTPYAAQLCNDLSVTGGYTTGWFLPAKNQLNTLFTNRVAIGGFADAFYWSSTEFAFNPAGVAWNRDFGSGNQNVGSKGSVNRVRCVRAFTP